jgi:hypothetical protein
MYPVLSLLHDFPDCQTSDRARQYKHSVARNLFAKYPRADKVTFVHRGGSSRDYAPRPADNEIIYVMSTGGRWGKSKEVRKGSQV